MSAYFSHTVPTHHSALAAKLEADEAANRREQAPVRNVVIYRDHLGGSSETFIYAQAAALRRYIPHFLGSRVTGPLPIGSDRVLTIGGRRGLPAVRELAFKFAKRSRLISRYLRDCRPSLVHAHFGPGGAVIGPLARREGIPFVVTFHGVDATMRDDASAEVSMTFRLFRRRRPWLQENTTAFVAVSDFIRDNLVRQGFPADRIIRHYVGIDLEQFRRDVQVERERVVLFVGRLVEVKGCEFLIRAMAEVQQSTPEVTLVVIGDGYLRPSLEALAAQLRIRVRFLGVQSPSEVRDWMMRASVFCVPSVTATSGAAEGFGIVFAEAAALGTPVVSSFSGGIPEAVEHGVTGLLAPERDIKTLAQQLRTLLSDSEVHSRMSEAGVARVRRLFDLRRQTALLEDVYDSIIARHA